MVTDNLLSEASPSAKLQSRPPSSKPPLHLNFTLAGVQRRYTWHWVKKEDILLQSALQWIEVPLARILEVRPIRQVALGVVVGGRS